MNLAGGGELWIVNQLVDRPSQLSPPPQGAWAPQKTPMPSGWQFGAASEAVAATSSSHFREPSSDVVRPHIETKTRK